MVKKIITSIIIIFAVVSAVLTLYWGFTFTGLYKIIANFELRIFDEYAVFSTGIFTLGILFLSFLIPLLILRLTILKKFYSTASNSTPLFPLENHFFDTKNFRRWTEQNYYRILGLAFLIILPLVGSYFIIRSLLAGPLTEIHIADLYNGKKPTSNFVRITGPVETGSVVSVELNNVVTYYFPLFPISSTSSRSIQLVVSKVYIDFSSEQPEWKGLISHLVPGFPKSLLEKKGYTFSDNIWFLEDDEDPSSFRGLGFGLAGGGIFLGTTILLIDRHYRNKRKNTIKT